MTATTIKVSTELRDQLKESAAAQHQTIGEHLAVLLAEENRRKRFADLRREMAESPPDLEYEQEAEQWQSDQWS